MVGTFMNNLEYAFKKMTEVILRGDLEALLKMNSGALYQTMVLDLAKVIYSIISLLIHPFCLWVF